MKKSEEIASFQESHMDLILQTLADHRYVYRQPIGGGGFAAVHLIYSEKYQQEFVVKITQSKPPPPPQQQDSRPQFGYSYSKMNKENPEISTIVSLTHPNIIQMYEYFYDDLFLYMVLEYCPGGSIDSFIKKQGHFHLTALVHMCKQILTALNYCHMLKIAHRDIKPGNILLDRNNRPKLADFGLSNFFYENSVMSTEFCGSKPFMAPELLQKTAYDPFKADIWALGVTFYTMATGKLPWNIKNEQEMRLNISLGFLPNNNLDPELRKLIKQMITVSPEKRANIDTLLASPLFTNSAAIPRSISQSCSYDTNLFLNTNFNLAPPSSANNINNNDNKFNNNNNNNNNNYILKNNYANGVCPSHLCDSPLSNNEHHDEIVEKRAAFAKCGSVLSFQLSHSKKRGQVKPASSGILPTFVNNKF